MRLLSSCILVHISLHSTMDRRQDQSLEVWSSVVYSRRRSSLSLFLSPLLSVPRRPPSIERARNALGSSPTRRIQIVASPFAVRSIVPSYSFFAQESALLENKHGANKKKRVSRLRGWTTSRRDQRERERNNHHARAPYNRERSDRESRIAVTQKRTPLTFLSRSRTRDRVGVPYICIRRG